MIKYLLAWLKCRHCWIPVKGGILCHKRGEVRDE